jgi:hypothetical protein
MSARGVVLEGRDRVQAASKRSFFVHGNGRGNELGTLSQSLAADCCSLNKFQSPVEKLNGTLKHPTGQRHEYTELGVAGAEST